MTIKTASSVMDIQICSNVELIYSDIYSGYLWSLESWCEDGAPVYLAQQSQQPVRESEERVQRHLLAGRYHSILPICEPSKRMRNCSAVLPGAGQAREGETLGHRSLLHYVGRCNGDMDWSLGWTQPLCRCFC